jgi:hypothetical protein
MAAVACLRVETGEAQSANASALAAKVIRAFLDSEWGSPRRHGRIGAAAFLLADPRAQEFGAAELCALAAELQETLFEDGGEASLLLFEGEQDQIMRFAACPADALRAALDGEAGTPPLMGRVRRVTARGAEPLAHPGDPEPQAGHGDQLTVTPEELLRRLQTAELDAVSEGAEPAAPAAGFHAVYHTPRQSLIGAAVSDGQLGAASLRGIFGNTGHIQGEAARRYDAHCVEASLPHLAAFSGMVFFPISFASIVNPPMRALYPPLLARLPAARRAQLAVSVYDTPRDPSSGAMAELTGFLRTYFGFLDLGVTDPGFRVEAIAAGSVNSVTLVLTGSDANARLSAIRRFMEGRESYKRQKILPAISHVRTRAELEACLAQRAPFVSGPAVSDLLDALPEINALQPSALPIRRAPALAQCA